MYLHKVIESINVTAELSQFYPISKMLKMTRKIIVLNPPVMIDLMIEISVFSYIYHGNIMYGSMRPEPFLAGVGALGLKYLSHIFVSDLGSPPGYPLLPWQEW